MIAHPARVALYELLVLHGPATVSQLAAGAGLAVGSASYHLKQLHAAGYVEDASAGQVDGRTQWWRAVRGGLRWEPVDFIGSAAGREVSSTAQRVLWARRLERLTSWLETWHTFERPWVEAALESDVYLRLTPAELAELGEQLTALTRHWAERSEQTATTDPDSRPVLVMMSAFPVGHDM